MKRRKIYTLLEEMTKNKSNQTINESVKIRKSEVNPQYGYYIFITSDESDPADAISEAAKMGAKLNLTSKTKAKWRKGFNPPKYYKDRKTGQFGWGYLIHPNITNEQSDQLLSNLKELVVDYNSSQSLEIDAQTAGLTVNQVGKLEQIIQATESVESKTENEEVKANLEAYLTELESAVENEEVFDFLIQTYEQAKGFQNRNTAWKYSLLNSLIITKGDPLAILAGPKQYWEDRNYKIKDEFVNKGIIITKYGSSKSDIFKKAMWFKNNPNKFNDFKADSGLGGDVTWENYWRGGQYQLAKYATKNKLLPKSKVEFSFAPTYTDSMVEAMPGKEVEPIGSDDLYVRERDVESREEVEILSQLFSALASVARKKQISTASIDITSDDINVFNRFLNSVTHKVVVDKLKWRLKGTRENREETEEMLKGYGEIVSHIVKKHFGLPSESSRYNIASLGVDREAIQKESNTIINIADKLIDELEGVMDSSPSDELNEIRKIVRKIFLQG